MLEAMLIRDGKREVGVPVGGGVSVVDHFVSEDAGGDRSEGQGFRVAVDVGRLPGQLDEVAGDGDCQQHRGGS